MNTLHQFAIHGKNGIIKEVIEIGVPKILQGEEAEKYIKKNIVDTKKMIGITGDVTEFPIDVELRKGQNIEFTIGGEA